MFILSYALTAAVCFAGDREEAKRFYDEGNSLYDQGRFAEAVADYDRALQQDPKLLEASYNRALADEMVDRQKALADWKRFLDGAADNPDFKWEVARAKARTQILESLPTLPEAMQPGQYVPAAGDYYRVVGRSSEGEQWRSFPVKVYLGSAPDIKWQQGAREAYDVWSGVFPLQVVALPERADIRFGWEESVEELGHAGEESDWVQIRRVGDKLTGRRVAVITVDLSHRWSKDEMRSIFLHEMGHALGIKSHSDAAKDIMYWRLQEKRREVTVSNLPSPIFWKSLVKQPGQRDINTLIRLYNSAGWSERFR